ncbi:hypothetical protein [Paenibacillus thermotolerans]|uniref:hypothetical protein n=1 Tax=Paenibacillus thermotolerans TaxID=3027807 RepID=UPI00236753B1|nr:MULTISPECIES: hypothetical protein [unclassified Paenibacillus]
MVLDQILGLFGIIFGAAGGAFGWWWGRRQAARKRGLDERFETISVKSLETAWKITLAAIYIIFILLVFGVQLPAVPAIGILMLVHMAGWAFSTIYYHLKL